MYKPKKDFYYFKHIHKDDKLSQIALKIEKLGRTSTGSWNIYRDYLAVKADDLVGQFKQRENELHTNIIMEAY